VHVERFGSFIDQRRKGVEEHQLEVSLVKEGPRDQYQLAGSLALNPAPAGSSLVKEKV